MRQAKNESESVNDDHPRISTILDGAMEILLEGGDHGLTMRQAAKRAGISLGHLQHYFSTKNDLLKALVGRHFESCIAGLEQHLASTSTEDPKELVESLVTFGLAYVGDEPSDTCRIFREFWALSPRNPEIRTHLDAYYREYADKLTELLLPVAETAAAARRAVALLVPWFEGYSVTSASIGVVEEELAKQLTELVVAVLAQSAPK